MSDAVSKAFPHNDVAALESILRAQRDKFAKVLIVCEGAYSMDGDVAPVPEYVRLKKQYGCFLMVDEAHSAGVLGATGAGVDEFFGLALQEPRLFRRKRRPQGRDDITDAPVMSGYDIHIAFDQDSLALLINRFMGQVHGEEKASLIENRRFRRIEVLRLAVVEDAPAEAYYIAAEVNYREHHAVAEDIVNLVRFLRASAEPRVDYLVLRVAL